MTYTPKEAWSNASRLLAICLGFYADQKRRMTRVSQTYNEDTGYHEIMIKLEVKHEVLLATTKAKIIEGNNLPKCSLIQDINNRLIEDEDIARLIGS